MTTGNFLDARYTCLIGATKKFPVRAIFGLPSRQ